MSETPDWAKDLVNALEGIGPALERVGHIFTAQGAMGYMVQGEFDKARDQLKKLPPEQLDILSMAARALAELAEDEKAGRP
jgi:hypothetical protein